MDRILYVEDDESIRTVAEMALEIVGGFTVYSCASGQEALEVASRVKPDLLLLDMMMPGMDGLASLQALRAIPATSGTPAIFMTAKVQGSEIASFKAAGALDVIPKPFDPLTLPDQIRAIWASRGGASEQPAA